VNKRKIVKAIRSPNGQSIDLIYAGKLPENPAELLGNGKFESLLVELRKQYDKIIIDSPPLLPVTDAAVLAPLVDGVVVFVRAGSTKQSQLRAGFGALESVSARVLGVVFNMIPIGTRDYVNYGYEHGYISPYLKNSKRYSSGYGSIIGTDSYYERIAAESPYAPDLENLKVIYGGSSQNSVKP
jgi:Mrp family chromosome partitioning ATPase